MLSLLIGCHTNTKDSLALYEQGKAYEKQQHFDSAAICYRQAIDLIENKYATELSGQIYNQLGDMFLQADLYDKSYVAYNEARKYSSKLTDQTTCSKALRGIGKTFAYQEVKDSAIYYFQQAYYLSEAVRDTTELSLINNNLSNGYLALKQYDKASYHNHIALTLSKDSTNLCRNWLIKADLFEEKQQYDSAWHYYELGSHSDYIYTKAACYSKLASLSDSLHRSDSEKYLRLYTAIIDTIDHTGPSIQIATTDQNFLFSKKENKYMTVLLSIFFSLFFFIGISVLLIFTHRSKLVIMKKKRKEENQKQNEIISRLHKDMSILQQEIGAMKDSEKYLSENREKHKKLQEIENDITQYIMNTAIYCTDKFLKSDIYKQTKQQMKTTNPEINRKERENLFRAINNDFEPFIQYLRTLMSIPKEDCFLCCLALAQFTGKESAVLRCVSWNAIRSQKSRIKTKFAETFHSLALYEFIFKHKEA